MSKIEHTRRFRTPDAARYLGISESTLEKDRISGKLGIPFLKLGKSVVYDSGMLDTWMAARARLNTSQAGAGQACHG
jgi:predicted DNA-binding transcriptional regulator AlpA